MSGCVGDAAAGKAEIGVSGFLTLSDRGHSLWCHKTAVFDPLLPVGLALLGVGFRLLSAVLTAAGDAAAYETSESCARCQFSLHQFPNNVQQKH